MEKNDRLLVRALRFYNSGEGLTRAEIVDMAKRLEVLQATMLKAATAIDMLHEHDGKGWSISQMLRGAARAQSRTSAVADEQTREVQVLVDAPVERTCLGRIHTHTAPDGTTTVPAVFLPDDGHWPTGGTVTVLLHTPPAAASEQRRWRPWTHRNRQEGT